MLVLLLAFWLDPRFPGFCERHLIGGPEYGDDPPPKIEQEKDDDEDQDPPASE